MYKKYNIPRIHYFITYCFYITITIVNHLIFDNSLITVIMRIKIRVDE